MNANATATGRTIDETVLRAVDEAGEIAQGFDAQQLRDLNTEIIDWTGLRRGDIVTFETVHRVISTEMQKEFRYGFDGMLCERETGRTEEITASETLKLWATPKRGMYWKAA